MARTTKTPRKNLNLATAEQADGALPAFRDAYELMGIRDFRFRETTFAAYQEKLRGLSLSELQDEAYNLAVVPSASAAVMIERLEEKYLRENPEQREQVNKARASKRAKEPTLDDRVNELLARAV